MKYFVQALKTIRYSFISHCHLWYYWGQTSITEYKETRYWRSIRKMIQFHLWYQWWLEQATETKRQEIHIYERNTEVRYQSHFSLSSVIPIKISTSIKKGKETSYWFFFKLKRNQLKCGQVHFSLSSVIQQTNKRWNKRRQMHRRWQREQTLTMFTAWKIWLENKKTRKWIWRKRHKTAHNGIIKTRVAWRNVP